MYNVTGAYRPAEMSGVQLREVLEMTISADYYDEAMLRISASA